MPKPQPGPGGKTVDWSASLPVRQGDVINSIITSDGAHVVIDNHTLGPNRPTPYHSSGQLHWSNGTS